MRTKRTLAAVASVLLAAGLLAVVAAPASAKGSLSFDDTPTGWTVTEGERDRNVGSVSASGIKHTKNIRYSLTGPAPFSITKRSGRVMYDGGSLDGTGAVLTITAKHRRGKAEPATITVSVAVNRAPSDDAGRGTGINPHDDEWSHSHRCTNPAGPHTHGDWHIVTPYDGEHYSARHKHKISSGTTLDYHTHQTERQGANGPLRRLSTPSGGHDGLCHHEGSQNRRDWIARVEAKLDAGEKSQSATRKRTDTAPDSALKCSDWPAGPYPALDPYTNKRDVPAPNPGVNCRR
ncbi:MAG: hypothetical protein OXG57_04830 [Acidimicrobiaceae bacterium]|nr:hypothetical protein [Acidimicrobiaceae bacterium]